MTKLERFEIEMMPTIAYWSMNGGIEVKKIEHGIEDYVTCVCNSFIGKHTYHRVKIQYSYAGRAYIALKGHRYYFEDCIGDNHGIH